MLTPKLWVFLRRPRETFAEPPRTMYDELKEQGAGYCPNCGAVVTPKDIANRPIRKARGV